MVRLNIKITALNMRNANDICDSPYSNVTPERKYPSAIIKCNSTNVLFFIFFFKSHLQICHGCNLPSLRQDHSPCRGRMDHNVLPHVVY